jgi:hypothetical protein
MTQTEKGVAKTYEEDYETKMPVVAELVKDLAI